MTDKQDSSGRSGRESFAKWELAIRLLVGIFRRAPKFLSYPALSVLGALPGSIGVGARYVMAACFAASVGRCVYLARSVVIKNMQGLRVGDRVSLHEFCYVDAVGGVTIGSDVAIAHGCSIVSFEHTWGDRCVPIKYNPTVDLPVVIGSDVWLGCGVRVLAGSVIEDRVVVAAGSVVKGRLLSNGLYAGVPARRVKELG